MDDLMELIFGDKKFYLEIQLFFKEATPEEIEDQDNLKDYLEIDMLEDFKVV